MAEQDRWQIVYGPRCIVTQRDTDESAEPRCFPRETADLAVHEYTSRYDEPVRRAFRYCRAEFDRLVSHLSMLLSETLCDGRAGMGEEYRWNEQLCPAL